MLDSTKACGKCDEPSSLESKNCRSIVYCSAECQKDDQDLYSLICKAFANFNEPRPSESHYRAFVFPEPEGDGKAEPELVWIESHYSDEQDYYESNEDQNHWAMGLEAGEPPKSHTDDAATTSGGDQQFVRIWTHKAANLVMLEWNSIVNKIDSGFTRRGTILIQTGLTTDGHEPLDMWNMEAKHMKDIEIYCSMNR